MLLAQRAADREAVGPREHHVEHEQIGRGATHLGERFGTVGQNRHVVPFSFKVTAYELGLQRIVLDDQDSGHDPSLSTGTARGRALHRTLTSPSHPGRSVDHSNYQHKEEPCFAPPTDP